MAIELSRLIGKVQHMDITLVAGEGGLSNYVTWVHMAETVEASDFLEGGQLAFTTGIGLRSKEDIFSLVKAFYEKKVSGAIFNIGPFIEEIPEEVKTYCNQHDFPLYVVPWKVHLAEIMRICCFAITKDEQRMMETSAAFKNAICFPKQEELYVVPLSQRSFRVNWKYSVTVIKLQTKTDKLEERLEALCLILENRIRHRNKDFAVFINEMELILVFANLSEEVLKEEIKEVQHSLNQLLRQDESYSMGVGRLTKSVRCLYKSYNQAKSIQRLQSRGKIGNENVFYTNLGIYRLLMGIEDREIIVDYYNHTLLPLREYDSMNHSDLCQTLRCYLTHDGSVKETADELFVHRNTVNYKINKIEELLGIEMSSLTSRAELIIAFKLAEIM
ncbi:MAG: PucR family transcriptional regulator ligand-binding domain-containing protein [Lachnospiraceae bacterium]|nr:PucR family transcriptional regulator ligand-binding domain-containing protein [Lachnospiraceae bacterium]